MILIDTFYAVSALIGITFISIVAGYIIGKKATR